MVFLDPKVVPGTPGLPLEVAFFLPSARSLSESGGLVGRLGGALASCTAQSLWMAITGGSSSCPWKKSSMSISFGTPGGGRFVESQAFNLLFPEPSGLPMNRIGLHRAALRVTFESAKSAGSAQR